jgi:uncharacterized protein (TIGR00730 family)
MSGARTLRTLCVYCGSSTGNSPAYAGAARALAAELAARNIALVYGGGNIGLMGIIANEVLRLGGAVTGIIPKALMDKEVGHLALTQLHVVKDMHERKAMMAELSDGFVALPGGIGTLEELFEAMTWSQLGLHEKPLGLLNVDGFYDGLLGFVAHQVAQGFLRNEHAGLLMHETEPAALLARLADWKPATHAGAAQQAAAKAILP